MQGESVIFQKTLAHTKKEGTELDLENSEYRKQNGDYEARMFLRRIYDRAEF